MPEAAAAPLAESLLVESVAAPAALDVGLGAAELGAFAPAAAEIGGLGGLLGGGVEAAGAGLGAGAFEGGVGALSSVAPEAAAQTSAALANAAPGANQIFYPEILQPASTAFSSSAPLYGQNLAAQQAAGGVSTLGDITGAGSAIDAPYVLTQTPTPNLPTAMTMEGATAAAPSNGIMDMLKGAGSWMKENPYKTAAGAAAAGYLLGKKNQKGVPEPEKYSGPLSKFHYNPSVYTPSTVQAPTNPYRAQYTSYAKGGIADLGSYSDGGRMLKGPGDGMSDSIPAKIAGKQPARLANEEFVVPADVVSHLGNGSSDAGAKQLYSMMDRVRKARTGSTKQGKQINPNKYMPA